MLKQFCETLQASISSIWEMLFRTLNLLVVRLKLGIS